MFIKRFRFFFGFFNNFSLCNNAGYLACARCSSTGALIVAEPVSAIAGGNHSVSTSKTERCSNCSGAGKVYITIKPKGPKAKNQRCG